MQQWQQQQHRWRRPPCILSKCPSSYLWEWWSPHSDNTKEQHQQDKVAAVVVTAQHFSINSCSTQEDKWLYSPLYPISPGGAHPHPHYKTPHYYNENYHFKPTIYIYLQYGHGSTAGCFVDDPFVSFVC